MAQALQSISAELSIHGPRSGMPSARLRAVPEARALVRSMAVPRILAGAGSDIVELVVELEEFGESEPVLLAGAALAYSWLDIAESALQRAASELAQTARPDVVEQVSLALLNVAMSRQRGDAVAGLADARHLQELIGNLTISERARTPELSPLMDYYVAGFELCNGNLNLARWTLERGAGRSGQRLGEGVSPAEQRIRGDCAGQLAWIDAFCGDLRRATWYATSLIADRPAASGEAGVSFAHLAIAWTHVEQGDFKQAEQHLSFALNREPHSRDALLVAAQRLTQARFAIVTDEPQNALRLLHSSALDAYPPSGWFADQLLVARAEAYLALDEPQQAIAVLTPEPSLATAEARLLLARALRVVGDPLVAEAIMGAVPADPLALSLITQVQRWLLQAEVASAQGRQDRAEILIDRVLCAACREELRATIGLAGGWLGSFVARNPALASRHSTFLQSVAQLSKRALQDGRREISANDTMVVPLTARETDVLRGLAEYSSNDEIAADLVLSLNTVKTHMRSLFQKLSVTRRADAVRRGRALGLC